MGLINCDNVFVFSSTVHTVNSSHEHGILSAVISFLITKGVVASVDTQRMLGGPWLVVLKKQSDMVSTHFTMGYWQVLLVP